MEKQNNICVCIDGSYWLYFAILGAFAEFKRNSTESEPFVDVESIDQDNLPDILNSTDFKREL